MTFPVVYLTYKNLSTLMLNFLDTKRLNYLHTKSLRFKFLTDMSKTTKFKKQTSTLLQSFYNTPL